MEYKIPLGKKLKSFSEEMRLRGMLPGSKLCEKKIVLSPSANMAAELKSEGKLLFLKRLRLADLKPMAVETSMLQIDRFPNLENRDFQYESFYEILEEEYNIKMTKAQAIKPPLPNLLRNLNRDGLVHASKICWLSPLKLGESQCKLRFVLRDI